MFRTLANLLYRRRDPTRLWQADPTQRIIDVTRCTVCHVPVGGFFDNLFPLGPSENAQRAAQGYLEWYSQGIACIIEDSKIGDFTITLNPTRKFASFPGQFLHNGVPIALSKTTTLDQLRALLGEPFAQSGDQWEPILFYEFSAGESQFYFDPDSKTLESIEFWYEPELSQPNACKTYGIDKPFPAEFKRQLPQ